MDDATDHRSQKCVGNEDVPMAQIELPQVTSNSVSAGTTGVHLVGVGLDASDGRKDWHSGQENGADETEEAAGWVDYSAQNEEALDVDEQRVGRKSVELGGVGFAKEPAVVQVPPVHLGGPAHIKAEPSRGEKKVVAEKLLGAKPEQAPMGEEAACTSKGPFERAAGLSPRSKAESEAVTEGGRNGPSSTTESAAHNGTGQRANEQIAVDRPSNQLREDTAKQSSCAEVEVRAVGDGAVQASGVDDAGRETTRRLQEPVEALQKLAATATEAGSERDGLGEMAHTSSADILNCGGVEKWEALLANIASGEIQLNPITGSFEHCKPVKKEPDVKTGAGFSGAAVQVNGHVEEKPREKRRASERSLPGRKRRADLETGGAQEEGTANGPKLATLVAEFVGKLEALLEQDLAAEMQRRASRCTPSTLGAKVSRLAGHPNAGRGPASGYMDDSAKNSAALREAAEPIIKALLFRGHYGNTTLAASMAGPLFYPANAAGPELLSALREACGGSSSAAAWGGPMRRLVLDLQEGARKALPEEGPSQEQGDRLQAWSELVSACVVAQVDLLEAVDFFKLCCAEAAAAAQEEAAGVMLTAKRSKRAILSSRQAAGSKSKWEHLEDSVAPLAQIVAQKYVAAAMHGGEGFPGLHARLQVLRADLLRGAAQLEAGQPLQPPSPHSDEAAGDPSRLVQAVALAATACGRVPSLAVAEADLPAVVREYVWADPGKWGVLWQQQGAACNGPQVPEPIALPLGGGGGGQAEAPRRRARGADSEEEDEYVGRWGRRVWRMKGAKKEWFNGQVVKGPKQREDVKPADKCYVMRYKPQDDPQGRSTLEKLTEAQVIRACENYEKAVAEGECAREDSESDDDAAGEGRQRGRPLAEGRGRKRSVEEAGVGASGEERGGGSKRKKGPAITAAAARVLLNQLRTFFGTSAAFTAARALYTGAERLFPRWECAVDGEGRHVYQWVSGRKLWHCFTRMQVRETQEEEGGQPLPPRIQLSTTPRPPPPPPKPAPPTPRPPPPRPALPPVVVPSRHGSPRPPSPSPPPAPRPPSAAAVRRPRPPPASLPDTPVLFSFEGPPPGCRLTPAQESEVMEVVRRQGWEIRQEVRKHGISAGQVDKYYMPPNGDKRLTSLRKVWEYLHHGKGATARTPRDRAAATSSNSEQAGFDAARGGVAALLAAQAATTEDAPAESGADEWDALEVGQGFGMAAAERVKRRRRKPGGTPGAYALGGSPEGVPVASSFPIPVLALSSPRPPARNPAYDAEGRGRSRLLTDFLQP